MGVYGPRRRGCTRQYSFRGRAAFSDGQGTRLVWAGRSRTYRIGLSAPILGIYDLFGNVSELAQDLFHSGLQSGKPGAYTVQGGSFLTGTEVLRSSLRAEVPLYEWEPTNETLSPSRSRSIGIRLALGSLTIATPDMRKLVSTNYEAYRQRAVRGATVVLTPISGVSGPDSLTRIDSTAQLLMAHQPEAARHLKANVAEARKILGDAMQRASRRTAGLCWAASVELAEAIFRARQARRAVDRAEQIAAENIRVT